MCLPQRHGHIQEDRLEQGAVLGLDEIDDVSKAVDHGKRPASIQQLPGQGSGGQTLPALDDGRSVPRRDKGLKQGGSVDTLDRGGPDRRVLPIAKHRNSVAALPLERLQDIIDRVANVQVVVDDLNAVEGPPPASFGSVASNSLAACPTGLLKRGRSGVGVG